MLAAERQVGSLAGWYNDEEDDDDEDDELDAAGADTGSGDSKSSGAPNVDSEPKAADGKSGHGNGVDASKAPSLPQHVDATAAATTTTADA